MKEHQKIKKTQDTSIPRYQYRGVPNCKVLILDSFPGFNKVKTHWLRSARSEIAARRCSAGRWAEEELQTGGEAALRSSSTLITLSAAGCREAPLPLPPHPPSSASPALRLCYLSETHSLVITSPLFETPLPQVLLLKKNQRSSSLSCISFSSLP